MKEPATRDALEIEVADFGPIVEAKVDLRPLTVFIGPSNTGKSYLAILIYALHRFFSRGPEFPGRFFFGGSALFADRGTQDLSDETVEEIFEMARSFSTDPAPSDVHTITIPRQAVDALRIRFDRNAEALGGEIGRCFGISELSALTRKRSTGKAHIVMRRKSSGNPAPMEHDLTLSPKIDFKTITPTEFLIPVGDFVNDFLYKKTHHRLISLGVGSTDLATVMGSGEETENILRFEASDWLASLGDMALPSLIGPLHLPAYYLPADRTGVMHAHSVVVSALIASASAAGLRPAANTPMLSGVLADFLEQLIEIDRIGRPRRNIKRDLGSSIEDDILGGSVRIERSALINYPHFTYRPRGWKDDLALANASSMVSELAPVVLYLRHVIEPGNVLIVEEPESHLHPAMQVEFTRQLAALVEAGVRVIVTTHSEWLVDELANIVRRSQLSTADRGDHVALRPDQVGAWLFEPKKRPKGSVVKEILLDDSGMYAAGYDEVASALYNDWAGITSRIEAGS